jgi:two-component system, chemotaxis family, chemotaxis protein CheY
MVKASLHELAGVHFLEASNGLEAIEQLALTPAALIVLDLNMPDMHGLDVLEFLRSHHRYAAIPVIVVTTRGDATSREAAMAAGATAYLTKPFAPAALAALARTLLKSIGVSV